MRRYFIAALAAGLALAGGQAFAGVEAEAPAPDCVVGVQGAVCRDLDAVAPPMIVGAEQLDLTGTLTVDDGYFERGWATDPGSHVAAHIPMAVTFVTVIRACEINLTLDDSACVAM